MKQRRFVTDISNILKKMLIAVVMMGVGLCFATDYTWTGAANNGGSWTTPGNWTPSTGYPGTDDKATFKSQSSAYEVSLPSDSDITVKDIVVYGDKTTTFKLNGHNLTVTNELNLAYNEGLSLYSGNVAFTGSGTTTINKMNTDHMCSNPNSMNVSSNVTVAITTWKTGGTLSSAKKTNVGGSGTVTIDSKDGNKDITPEAGSLVSLKINGSEQNSELANIYTWLGTDTTKPTDWYTAANWSKNGTNEVPNSTTARVFIPAVTSPAVSPIITNGESYNVKSISFDSGATLQLDGTLTVNDDHTLTSNITTSSETGILEITGKLTVTSDYSGKISVKCNSLEATANLELKKLEVTTTATLENNLWLENGTSTFGGTVTFQGSNQQIIITGGTIANPVITKNGGSLIFHNYGITLDGTDIDSGASNYELKINAPVTFTSNPNISKATSVTFENGCTSIGGSGTKTFATDVIFISDTTISIAPDIIVSGNLTDGGTTTFNGMLSLNSTNESTFTPSANSTYKKISIYNSKKNLATDITATELDIQSGTLDANNNTITLSGDFTNAGTFQNGNLHFTDNATISGTGTTSIKNLSTKTDIDAAKTLTINAGADATPVTIETLNLQGNTTNKWTIAGSGVIKLSSDQDSGNYLNISSSSCPTIKDTFYYAANSTTDDSDTLEAKHWIFGNANEWLWRGTTSNAWETATNWLPKSKPTSDATQTIVKIPAETDVTYSPLLSENVSIKTLTLVAGAKLSVTTGNTLTVADVLSLPSTSTLSGSLSVTNASGITIPASNTLTLAGTTTLGGKITNNGTITATSPQTLTITNELEDSGTIDSSINLKFAGASASGTVTFTPNTSTTYNEVTFTSGNLEIKNNLKVTNAINWSSSGNVIAAGTSGSPITITAPSIKTIGSIIPNQNKAEGSATAYLSLVTDTSGSIEIGGNIGGTSDFYDTVELSTNESFTVTGNTNTENITIKSKKVVFNNSAYIGNVTIQASDLVSINGLTANNLSIKKIDPSNSSGVALSSSDDIVRFGNKITINDSTNGLTISYPVKLISNTEFITTGNFTLTADGSITPADGLASSPTIKITAGSGKQIELNNDISSNGKNLSSVAFSSEVNFAAANKTIYAETTEFSSGSSIASGSNAFSIKKDLKISGGDFTYPNEEFEVPGNLTITSGSATFSNKLTTTSVSNAGKLTLGSDSTVTGNFTNTGTATDAVTNNATLSIGGNLTDINGKWKEGAGIIKFNGTTDQTFATNTATKYNGVQVEKTSGKFTVSSDLKAGTVTITKLTADGTYSGTVEADTFTLTDGKNTTFAQSVTVTSFDIQSAENTTFSKTVTIGTFNDNPDNDASTNAGNITFAKPGKITSDTTFSTTGQLTFSEGFTFATSDNATKYNVTHTTGTTAITGTITANNITLKTVTGGAITIANSGIFTLEDKDGIDDIASADLECSSFEQTGNGLNNLSGDIKATAGSVSFATGITLTGNVKIESSNAITLTGTTDGTFNLNLNASNTINFYNSIGHTTALNEISAASTDVVTFGTNTSFSGTKLDITGNLKINKTSATDTTTFNLPVTVSENLTVEKGKADFESTLQVTKDITTNSGAELALNGASSAANATNNGILITSTTAPLTISENFTNNGTTTDAVANNATLSIGGNLTDTNGKWKEGAGIIKFNGTTDQTFATNTATKYNEVQVEKTSGKFTVSSDLKAGTVSITKLTEAGIFAESVTVASFSIQSADNTTFSKTVTIGTFNDNPDSDASTNAGNITFAKPGKITSDTTFSTTGKLTFSEGFTFATSDDAIKYDVTHTTTGETTIGGTLTANNINLAKTTISNNPTIECTTITFADAVSNNSGNTYIKINGNLDSSNDSVNIEPKVMLNGNFTGTKKATFKNNVYIVGPSSLKNLSVEGDLIFDSTGPYTTDGEITANNIVLYRGTINAAANSVLNAVNDIILLGTGCTNSNPTIEYHNLSKLEYFGQNENFSTPKTMPDGTSLTTFNNFSGSYTASNGSQLYAGKNFYANGVTFTSSDNATWYIDLPDIRDTTKGFAEAYNCNVTYSTVRCHNNTTDLSQYTADGSQVRLPAYNCTDSGNNNNWLFEEFVITSAYTVRDNAIRINFNHPVRNQHDEINTHISDIKNSSGSYSHIYKEPDCITAYDNEDVYKTDDDIDYYFYIKSPNNWNTDATGSGSVNPSSTDRNGTKCSTIPYIDYSSDVDALVDVWGKRLTSDADGNGGSSSIRTNVLDNTGPVLYKVLLGQEQHTPYDRTIGAASQPDYDSHNFIEFRYSEPVNFGDPSSPTNWNPAPAPGSPAPTDAQGFFITQQVDDSLGAITGDITASSNVTLAGLGTLQTGKLHTGSNGSNNKYVNSLYRIDPYTIRLAIAGYTEGTTTDRDGNVYKNWKGYIESAIPPSGTVSMPSPINPMVTDCATNSNGQTNPQEEYAPGSKYEPTVELSDPLSGIYGPWDLSAPVFAPLRLKASVEWSKSAPGQAEYYEAVGNTSGAGSTLQKIEFHFFDNTPDYQSSDHAWLTERGWVENVTGSKTLWINNGDTNDSYCADIFGGSRPKESNLSYRTTGGLRFSTISNINTAFKYIASQSGNPVPNIPFANTPGAVFTGAKAPLFTGSSNTRRSADDPDGLYFGLQLPDVTMALDQSFTISYDDSVGFATDLAGNRLRSATIKTIDRTPPSYDFMLSPINQDELYMVFVKELVTNTNDLNYNDSTGTKIPINENFESLIPKCFQIFTMDADGNYIESTDLKIDTSSPANISTIESNSNHQIFTLIKLHLNKNINLKDLENTYIRVTLPTGYSKSQDPVTGLNDSNVSFIQDNIGNYMQINSAHSISDFAINTMKPLYAYDQDMSYKGETIMDGLYENGSWAVHDWEASQQNYGTLPANHPYGLVADFDIPSDINCKSVGARLFLSAEQPDVAISKQINTDLNLSLRIWLPELKDGLFQFMALENTPVSNYSTVDSELLDSSNSKRFIFNIPKEYSEKWGGNKQITYLFGLLDSNNELVRIYSTPYYDVANDKYNLRLSNAVPLYAIRMKNISDLESLDLWSFRTKSITEQRGGVTILNNVINATNGEKVALKVNMPSEGKLNVTVMTLDGNIITYLNHGNTNAGEHYFSWNGRNKAGNLVARGMYFIRVVGNGIDETRKVMVVK